MKVRITTETHEHEDKPVTPGTILDVSDKAATMLVRVGAAELVAPAAEPGASKTSTAASTGGAS